jgi:L-ascorbate metabolism protein UlaG (beta-lactamase superfamily)
MTKDEALKLALEALETELAVDMTNGAEVGEAAEKMCEAITALKAALEAKDEPWEQFYPEMGNVCDEMEKKAEEHGTKCCKWPTPSDCAYAIRARGDNK